MNSAQLLEHFRGSEQGNQLAKILCWQHHIARRKCRRSFLRQH